MKIFVALTFLVIAAVTAKDLRIEIEPGLRHPGSGMALNNFLGIICLFPCNYGSISLTVLAPIEIERSSMVF